MLIQCDSINLICQEIFPPEIEKVYRWQVCNTSGGPKGGCIVSLILPYHPCRESRTIQIMGKIPFPVRSEKEVRALHAGRFPSFWASLYGETKWEPCGCVCWSFPCLFLQGVFRVVSSLRQTSPGGEGIPSTGKCVFLYFTHVVNWAVFYGEIDNISFIF